MGVMEPQPGHPVIDAGTHWSEARVRRELARVRDTLELVTKQANENLSAARQSLDLISVELPDVIAAAARVGEAAKRTPQQSAMLSTKEAGQYLSCSPAWLAKARQTGEGPPFVKLGTFVRYDRTELQLWIHEQRQRSMSCGLPTAVHIARKWDSWKVFQKQAGVYFIGDSEVVKIGTSENICQRLLTLGASSPAFRLFAIIPKGTGPSENDLHRRFASRRHHGEWFKWNRELALLINSLEHSHAAGHQVFDPVPFPT